MSNQSLINAADAVLTALGEVLETAYHSAKIGPDGEAVWSDADQYIMSALSPYHGPLVAALSEATKSDNWQPIETVPDEQEVLLLWHPCGVVRQGSLYVNNGEHKFFRLVLDYGDFYSTVVTSHDDCPTHWQPLPPPPSEV